MSAPRGPVVCAYDGSPAARQAIVDAAKLLAHLRLLVVTVWDPSLAYLPPPAPGDPLTPAPPLVDPRVAEEVDTSLHEQAERISREGAALAREHGLDAEALAVPDDGDIANTIVSFAEDRAAVAIVVGSRGLTGLKAALEGSTAKSVVKHSVCPVLVVHKHDEPEN